MAEFKYFIITAGATGSGKTGLIDKTMDYLGIKGEEFEKILIDDLVENNSKYKEKVKAIIEDINKKCNNNNDCKSEKFNNPDENLYKAFNDAYFTTRSEKGCLKNNNKTCDELNDENIHTYVSQKKHIIFEFTGQYIPKWLLNNIYINENYKIVFSYSLVTLKNLIERNKSRAIKSIQAFETSNYSSPAPRLPDLSETKFTEIVTKIKDVLNELYNTCILKYDESNCGSKKIDRLLIFDNNGESLVNIFDSMNSKDFDFEKLVTNSGVGGGARRKSSRKIPKKTHKKKTRRNRRKSVRRNRRH